MNKQMDVRDQADKIEVQAVPRILVEDRLTLETRMKFLSQELAESRTAAVVVIGIALLAMVLICAKASLLIV